MAISLGEGGDHRPLLVTATPHGQFGIWGKEEITRGKERDVNTGQWGQDENYSRIFSNKGGPEEDR